MRNKRKRTPVTILLLAGMILSLLTGCGSEPVENKPETVTESSTESASLAEAEAETPEETKPTVRKKIAAFNYEKAAEYLFDYYGIEPDQEETLENINGMIRALGGEEIEADYTGTISTGSVELNELNEQAAAEGTAEKIAEVQAQLENEEVYVFDTSKFTVDGKNLDSYKADVDTDANYEADTEVVSDGYFHESEYRSAPYFDLRIDGITLLDEKY